MKTIIHFFILLMITFSLTGCPDTITPTESITVNINNLTSKTLNLYYADNIHCSEWVEWTDTLHSVPSSKNMLFGTGFFHAKDIRNDVFVAIKNKSTDKQLIIIEELSGDTLAKWNDSSIVFTEQQYWTITTSGSEYYTDYDCTLELTDEVLKLK